MARIGVQTGGLTQIFGVEGAYREIREAGFDAADVNLDELLTYGQIVKGEHAAVFDAEGEVSLRWFKPWKDAAEKYGVENYQAHAPFPSCRPAGDEYNEYLLQALEKTIAGCAYIGCSRLIVHPFFLGYDQGVSAREEWDTNIRCYSRLIPAAKRHGVTICLENMFSRWRGKVVSACCSDFDVACRYVDELNALAGETIFGFCLDVGHALLLGKDIKRVMEQLGGRIQAFHIHDNNGTDDLHMAPYMGIQDWDRFVQGLQAIGYRGVLSFETYAAIRAFPPEMAPDVLRLIAKSGRLFAQKAGI